MPRPNRLGWWVRLNPMTVTRALVMATTRGFRLLCTALAAVKLCLATTITIMTSIFWISTCKRLKSSPPSRILISSMMTETAKSTMMTERSRLALTPTRGLVTPILFLQFSTGKCSSAASQAGDPPNVMTANTHQDMRPKTNNWNNVMISLFVPVRIRCTVSHTTKAP